jgi:hypothetical protein
MIQPDKPLVCRWCHEETGYTERGIMHLVLPDGGLKCKNCGEVFLRNDKPMLSTR